MLYSDPNVYDLEDDGTSLEQLNISLSTINAKSKYNIILSGDLNQGHIDWKSPQKKQI